MYLTCNHCRDLINVSDDYLKCKCGVVWCSKSCARREGWVDRKRTSYCKFCGDNDNDYLFDRKVIGNDCSVLECDD